MRTKIWNVNTLRFCLPHVPFMVQISYTKAFSLASNTDLKLPDAKLIVLLKLGKSPAQIGLVESLSVFNLEQGKRPLT